MREFPANHGLTNPDVRRRGAPRSHRAPVILLIALAVHLTPAVPGLGTARADIGAPLTVKLVGQPPLLEPGESYDGVLRVTVDTAGTLSMFGLAGPGWSVTSFDAPAEAQLAAGQSLDISFTAAAADPAAPLRLTFRLDGRTVRRGVDLSPRAGRWARETLPTIAESPLTLPFAYPASGGIAFGPAARDLDEPMVRAEATKASSIDVSGQFIYRFRSRSSDERGAYGVTVRIYDDDTIGRSLLGETVTGPDGTFSLNVSWGSPLLDTYPDLYAEFRCENSLVDVRPGTFLGGGVYVWKTDVSRNHVGSVWNVGRIVPADEDSFEPLHILTTIMRAQSWLDGYSAPPVTVNWPEDGTISFYRSSSETVHMTRVDSFDDFVIVHEFGHHWVYSFAESPAPEYCNGICDDDGCGHCLWCEEDATIAWTEGFPDWMGIHIPETFLADYGIAGSNLEGVDFETPLICDVGSTTPSLVEGYTAALLTDMSDDNPGSGAENNGGSPFDDSMSGAARNILQLVDLDAPTTARQFIDDYIARFGGARSLWETATSVGYGNLDNTAPPAPAAINSSSHDVGVESADRTVEIVWGAPTDDFSGVNAYSIRVASTAGMPDQTPELLADGAAGTYTTEPLAPGTWYLSVRSRDAAGNWSAAYTSYGPIDIREAIDADLTAYEPGAAWNGVFNLRNDDDAIAAIAPATASLDGGGSTWWNFGAENLGDVAMGSTTQARLYIDDVHVDSHQVANLAGGGAAGYINLGPVQVRGGRHVASLHLDAGNSQVSESDETNNIVVMQRVWEPAPLPAGITLTRQQPPEPQAGAADFGPGTVLVAENKDGVRIDGQAMLWTVTGMWTVGETSDYTLSLHEPSTGQSDGFGTSWLAPAHSRRGAGELDLVVGNQVHASAPDAWDVGITKRSGGGSYRIRTMGIETSSMTSVVNATVDVAEVFDVGTFTLNTAATGTKSLKVQTISGSGVARVAIFPPSALAAGLNEALVTVVTGADGKAEASFTAADVGAYCVVFWRDPKDVDEGTAGSITLRADIITSSASFALTAPSGWAGRLVPRADSLGAPGSVELPTELHGGVADTYLNIAVGNLSPIGAPGCSLVMSVDGAPLLTAPLAALAAGATHEVTSAGPILVRGGRHTLTALIDLPDSVSTAPPRLVYSEQFVFTPPLLPPAPLVVPEPPSARAFGAGAAFDAGDSVYYECDGYRVPANAAVFYGAAVMPEPDDDMNLRAHEASTGIRDGFAEHKAFSGWGRGESDFVLLNTARTPARPFDVGIIGVDAQSPYLIQSVSSTALTPGCPGTCGPFTLAANEIVHLYSVPLAPGTYNFLLEFTGASSSDLGLSLYPADRPWLAKSSHLDDALSWLNGPGESESVAATITAPGAYCLAVWRSRSPEGGNKAAESASYTLSVTSYTSDVGGDLPAIDRVALHAPEPNPFNPQTTLAFDLPSAGPAQLAIFDLAGRRVRTLVDEHLASGRHQVPWDGRDAAGRAVASGSYLARLVAGGTETNVKLMLLR